MIEKQKKKLRELILLKKSAKSNAVFLLFKTSKLTHIQVIANTYPHAILKIWVTLNDLDTFYY